MSTSIDMSISMESSADSVPEPVVTKEVKAPKATKATKSKDVKKVTKKTVAKKETKTAKPKKTTAPATFIPAEMTKKFTPKTFTNFCEKYFNAIYDKNLSFVKYTSEEEWIEKEAAKKTLYEKSGKTYTPKEFKENTKQVVVDMSTITALDKLRTELEGCENISEFNSFNPYMHTIISYFKDPKLRIDHEAFAKLCIEDFSVKSIDGIDYDAIMTKMKTYTENVVSHAQKSFNNSFGDYFAKKYPNDGDIYKRYIQRAPKKIMEILDLKASKFSADIYPEVVKMYYKDPANKRAAAINALLKDNSIEASVLDKENNKVFNDLTISKIRNNEVFMKATAKKAITDEDIKDLTQLYMEIQVANKFIQFINEIDDQKFFVEKLAEIKSTIASFTSITTHINDLIAENEYSKVENIKWINLIRGLAYLCKPHTAYGDPTKPFITMMRNADLGINIRNAKLKDEISKVDPSDVDAVKVIATTYISEIEQLTIPSTYNPTMMSIYDDLGNYIYYNWKTTSPVRKLTKTIRIGIGMIVFQFIKNQMEIINSSKISTIKIAIKF